jgi:hypothetical protein
LSSLTGVTLIGRQLEVLALVNRVDGHPIVELERRAG